MILLCKALAQITAIQNCYLCGATIVDPPTAGFVH